MLPELLNQIPSDQEIASAPAVGAYDTRKCHDAIAERGAAAVIPPRKNARLWKANNTGAIARNEALLASQLPRPCAVATPLGRLLRNRLPGNGSSGYHCRSHVDTTMHCVKLLGQRLMARDFDRQARISSFVSPSSPPSASPSRRSRDSFVRNKGRLHHQSLTYL